jgi:hypothetical protein
MALFAAGLVQFVDTGKARAVARGAVANRWERTLDWPKWSSVIEGSDAVDMYPSYGCWAGKAFKEEVLLKEREIEFIAARSGKRTNGGRTARPLHDCAVEDDEVQATIAGRLRRRGHLYVFMSPAFASEGIHTLQAELNCRDLGEALVCSDR